MAQMMTISLSRGDSPNLGFRLQGGVDFAQPLVIQKVNGGSPAERAGLQAGDAVIKINNTDVFNLRHKDAQDVIIKAGSAFSITIQRGGSTWKPSVVPSGPLIQGSISPVTKTSLAAKQQTNIDAIGTGHNVAAKPYANGTANGAPKLVNKQYNTPIGLYSEQSIAETLTAQSEVLSTGVLGVNFKKNEKNYDATKSAVYSMLQEAERDPRDFETEPDSGVVTAPLGGAIGLKHVEAPISKPAPAVPPTPQLPPGQNICADCERLIVGVFVRIKDKNLHVECFKCSTCGASLKNVGYYNINNKLYCDVHAKLAAKANPPGANLVPVTIPPGAKAPTNTISAALASHSLPSPGPLSPNLGGGPLSPKYPGPLSPKLPSAGPISPSQNTTAAPFQPDASLTSAKLLKNIIQAAAKKGDAKIAPELELVRHEDAVLLTTANNYDNINKINTSNIDVLRNLKLETDHVDAMNNNNNVLKQNYTNAPRPFSSVSAPLSPGGFSRPLPKSPVHAPQAAPVFAPPPPPQAHSAPGFTSAKPAGGGMFKEHETEIVYSDDRVEITTTMGPQTNANEQYYNEINVSIPMPTFAPSLSSESSPRSYVSCNSNASAGDKTDYYTSSKNNLLETTFPSLSSTNDPQKHVHRAKTNKQSHNNPNANPVCSVCNNYIRGPFISALGKIWCPDHFVCATASCKRPLQDIGFVEEQGNLHCEYCFEQYLAPNCAKCGSKIKGDCLKAIGKAFHPECFSCAHCGKLFGHSPFFLEDGLPYCEGDWNEMFTTKCFACGFPVEAGDRWVEALNNNYHSQCFNCTMCKKNLEGQSFYAKGGRPFCKNHAR